jgi:hypothetical protein
MFTSEQNIDRKHLNQSKKAISENGMHFAKKSIVKFRLTYYKELTIAFGIAIAILVFAVNYSSGQTQSSALMPSFELPSIGAKTIFSAVARVIF